MKYDQPVAEWINQNRLRFFDQFFIIVTDTVSVIVYSIPILLLIYAFYQKRRVIKIKGFEMLCSIVLSSVIVTTIKHMVRRQRPYEVDRLIEKLSVGGGYSFPSGHTADAFVMATALSFLLQRRRWLLAPVWIWAFMVAYTRMMLGVHYLSDVVTSMLIGSLSFIIIHRFFKKQYIKSDLKERSA